MYYTPHSILYSFFLLFGWEIFFFVTYRIKWRKFRLKSHASKMESENIYYGGKETRGESHFWFYGWENVWLWAVIVPGQFKEWIKGRKKRDFGSFPINFDYNLVENTHEKGFKRSRRWKRATRSIFIQLKRFVDDVTFDSSHSSISSQTSTVSKIPFKICYFHGNFQFMINTCIRFLCPKNTTAKLPNKKTI